MNTQISVHPDKSTRKPGFSTNPGALYHLFDVFSQITRRSVLAFAYNLPETKTIAIANESAASS